MTVSEVFGHLVGFSTITRIVSDKRRQKLEQYFRLTVSIIVVSVIAATGYGWDSVGSRSIGILLVSMKRFNSAMGIRRSLLPGMRYPFSRPVSNHFWAVRGATLQILATSPVVRTFFPFAIIFALLNRQDGSKCNRAPIRTKMLYRPPAIFSRHSCLLHKRIVIHSPRSKGHLTVDACPQGAS